MEVMQPRHHVKHATRYHTAKLEQAPWMVELGSGDLDLVMHYQYKENRYRCSVYVAAVDHHHRLPYSFPSSFLILPCQVKLIRKKE